MSANSASSVSELDAIITAIKRDARIAVLLCKNPIVHRRSIQALFRNEVVADPQLITDGIAELFGASNANFNSDDNVKLYNMTLTRDCIITRCENNEVKGILLAVNENNDYIVRYLNLSDDKVDDVDAIRMLALNNGDALYHCRYIKSGVIFSDLLIELERSYNWLTGYIYNNPEFMAVKDRHTILSELSLIYRDILKKMEIK